jgi:hypothetical protein
VIQQGIGHGACVRACKIENNVRILFSELGERYEFDKMRIRLDSPKVRLKALKIIILMNRKL